MSLRATLNQMIFNRRGDIVSINEIYEYCKKAGYKQSNAERTLRPSSSKNVEAIKKNGYIIGYRWVDHIVDTNKMVEPIVIDNRKEIIIDLTQNDTRTT